MADNAIARPTIAVNAAWLAYGFDYARHVDWGCVMCAPHSDMLQEGWRCYYHGAVEALIAARDSDPLQALFARYEKQAPNFAACLECQPNGTDVIPGLRCTHHTIGAALTSWRSRSTLLPAHGVAL